MRYMNRVVTYFSASGMTAQKAKELSELLSADLYEIVPEYLYTVADLDWRDKNSRSTLEMKNRDQRPELKETDHDFSAYDEIWIGFPIWWYTAPTIINTFIEKYDFSGKKIILFATSGGSRIDKAVEDTKKQYPHLNIDKGVLRNGKIDEKAL